MLRRWLSLAVKVSEVAEKTMWGATSHSSPGSIPFTDRFIWIVSPGRGGSDRLRALHRPASVRRPRCTRGLGFRVPYPQNRSKQWHSIEMTQAHGPRGAH